MTNLEAIRANISDAHGVVLSENHFVKALVDTGLTATTAYNNARAVDRATLRLYDQLIATANLSEGALGYNVDLGGLMRARNMLAEKLGMTDHLRNTVNTANPW